MSEMVPWRCGGVSFVLPRLPPQSPVLVGLPDLPNVDIEGGEPAAPAAVGVDALQEARGACRLDFESEDANWDATVGGQPSRKRMRVRHRDAAGRRALQETFLKRLSWARSAQRTVPRIHLSARRLAFGF